jgi:hypothetical protein
MKSGVIFFYWGCSLSLGMRCDEMKMGGQQASKQASKQNSYSWVVRGNKYLGYSRFSELRSYFTLKRKEKPKEIQLILMYVTYFGRTI